MTYLYAYKTSDGKRHEERMRSGSKEAVFEALRARGIRPIKVELVGGVRRRAFALVAAGALVGAAVVLGVRRPDAASAAPRVHGEEFRSLSAAADDLLGQLRTTFALSDLASLRDYRMIETNAASEASLDRELNRVGALAAYFRGCLRETFRDLPSRFAADGEEEYRDAQWLYGRVMGEMDAADGRLEAGRGLLTLLGENRGRWRVESDGATNRVVFADAELQRQFDFCESELD